MGPVLRLILGLVALVCILAGVATTLPDHVIVVRSIVINAPEAAVFPYLNQPKRYPSWLPWAARDPNLQLTYSGPKGGQGAAAAWSSQDQRVGEGHLKIVESEPPNKVVMAGDYNGVEGDTSFEIAPSGAGAKVTWKLRYDSGSNIFRPWSYVFRRWKGLMLDRLVGAEHDRGLARLKAVVEADVKPEESLTGEALPPARTDIPESAVPENATPGNAVPMQPQNAVPVQ
ncbi:SRPBCC family protein [Methyloligella sp. 2.7D]|uniref:SRPBCC family protein n=1 Tax=unclassified Methyloligella TaxID=2625955 RepID=UPI00157DE123|nr:SRPBCC family protein [Methyloligella sp. GL2]QKP77071.1 SRPBCC family protein [Methyloligella sp. GL2]